MKCRIVRVPPGIVVQIDLANLARFEQLFGCFRQIADRFRRHSTSPSRRISLISGDDRSCQLPAGYGIA